MGGICEINEIDRFMRSPEGQEYLEEIRQMLEGRAIQRVTFSNEVHSIATTLHLDDNSTFFIAQPSLQVEAIREEFADMLEREHRVDYSERKPSRPVEQG